MLISIANKYLRFTNIGLSFKYKSYGELTYLWPWSRSDKKHQFKSNRFGDVYFLSLKDFEDKVNDYETNLDKKGKILGFSLRSVIELWCKVTIPSGYYVVLYEVDVSKKDSSFWDRIPATKMAELTKDVITLHCKDYREADILYESIDEKFASAGIVRNGVVLVWNSKKWGGFDLEQ